MTDDLPPLPEPAWPAHPVFYAKDPWTGAAHNPGPMWSDYYTAKQMHAYAAQAMAAERERCAKLCEDMNYQTAAAIGDDLARAIRNRGTP